MRNIKCIFNCLRNTHEKASQTHKLKKKYYLHSSSHFVPKKHLEKYSHRVTASRSQVPLLLQEGQTITETKNMKTSMNTLWR